MAGNLRSRLLKSGWKLAFSAALRLYIVRSFLMRVFMIGFSVGELPWRMTARERSGFGTVGTLGLGELSGEDIVGEEGSVVAKA